MPRSKQKSTSIETPSRFAFLFEPVEAYSVAIFRIVFGVLMLWECYHFMDLGFAKHAIAETSTHLHYPFLTFLPALPLPFLYLLLLIMTVSCVLITLGVFYRYAMIAFLVSFSYYYYIDTSYYNNHLYLISLLAVWMIFIQADQVLSLGKKKPHTKIPAWQLWVLKLHFVIVYFFGGIAKLNPDWLFQLEPVGALLSQVATQIPSLSDFFTSEGMKIFIAYGGLIFDLTVGFLLLIRVTRPFAIAGALFFNLSNAFIFDDINIFPFFMVAATLLFCDPGWVKEMVFKLQGKKIPQAHPNKKPIQFAFNQRIVYIIGFYFLIHILLPFRHHLIKGHVDWTTEAQNFSWRMKIQQRNIVDVDFRVFDNRSKTVYPVDLTTYGLTHDQIVNISTRPLAAWQFAQYLEEFCREKQNMPDVMVKAKIMVSLNKHDPLPLVDQNVDLTSVEYSMFRHNEWITDWPY